MRERTGGRRSLDVEELASRGAILAGVLEADSLPRVLEVAAARLDPVAYRIEFARDLSGRPKMSGHVEGILPFVCQRCLGRLDWAFDATFESVVVERGQEDTGGPDAVTCSGGRIELNLVIEDEILLALPNAPVHPHGTCEAPSLRAAREQAPSRRSNPFSALRSLRSNNGREKSD